MGSQYEDDRSLSAIAQSIWAEQSHRRRLDVLRALPPDSMPTVFERLCDRALEEDGMAAHSVAGLCDDWLAEVGCDDLREDWQEPHRHLIRPAAVLAWRLIDRKAPVDAVWNEPHVPLFILRIGVRTARQVAQELAKPRLGLALVNRLLDVAPRAFDHETGAPKADVARYEILGIAVACLGETSQSKHRDRGRALIAELGTLGESLKHRLYESEELISLEINSASLVHILGDWALAEGRPRAASEAYQAALDRFEALERMAEADALGTGIVTHIRTGMANTLWRLSKAYVRGWDLDQAYLRCKQAVGIYRELDPHDPVIAAHLRSLAEIAWMQTDFDAAAALLDEAAQFAPGDASHESRNP